MDRGDDDYFSDDLDDARLAVTFGRINRPTLIMPSEDDEMMPPAFPKSALLRRWFRASPAGLVSELSGVVPGADHALSAVDSQRWFAERVVLFLRSLNSVHV